MIVVRRILIAFLVLVAPTLAYSQDDPRVGVAISSPGAFGVIWNVNDAFAIRPEITVSRTSGDTTSAELAGTPSPVTNSDSTSVGAAVAGLFYFARKDALRPYLSPRFAYSRANSSSSTDSNSILGPSTGDSIVSSYAGAGSLGAQYSLGRRFSVWGQLGASYTRTVLTSTSTFTSTITSIVNGVLTVSQRVQTTTGSAHQNQVATRAAVGVIVYF